MEPDYKFTLINDTDHEVIVRSLICAKCGKGGGTMVVTDDKTFHQVCIIPMGGKAIPVANIPNRRFRREYLRKQRLEAKHDASK